jgi:hypothetical protein
MTGRRLTKPEAVLDGGQYEVVDVVAGDAARGGKKAHERSQQSRAKATRTFSPLSH